MSDSRYCCARNREYWSRRYSRWGVHAPWGRFTKTLTHRKERREGRVDVAEVAGERELEREDRRWAELIESDRIHRPGDRPTP